jgi:hypothetical protein
MLAPGQVYYKPWRVVHSLTSSDTTGTTLNFTGTFSVTPTDLGLSLFGPGEIYFEIRFIGHRAILPICYSATSSLPPTPTPTPTPTATSGPTPTPTPTSTLTPTPTPTATSYASSMYVSGMQSTCSNFCTTNYNISTLTGSEQSYASVSVGDILDISVAGFYAVSNISTDTTTGPFKIIEIQINEGNGTVTDVLQCSGGSCVPL